MFIVLVENGNWCFTVWWCGSECPFSVPNTKDTAQITIQTPHMYVCIYVCRFQNVVLRCPTPRLHCFLSSHWPSFRFLSFMAFLIPSIQFFFGLPRALFCFGIRFNAILGNLPSAILWTWPYHVSWFCSISFIIASSNPLCCLIVTFLIFSCLDIIEDLLRASIVLYCWYIHSYRCLQCM